MSSRLAGRGCGPHTCAAAEIRGTTEKRCLFNKNVTGVRSSGPGRPGPGGWERALAPCAPAAAPSPAREGELRPSAAGDGPGAARLRAQSLRSLPGGRPPPQGCEAARGFWERAGSRTQSLGSGRCRARAGAVGRGWVCGLVPAGEFRPRGAQWGVLLRGVVRTALSGRQDASFRPPSRCMWKPQPLWVPCPHLCKEGVGLADPRVPPPPPSAV